MRVFKKIGYYFLIFLLLLFVKKSEANVVLKVVSVNPSKEQVQKVDIKTYLPKETKPEDVIDKADLEIAYDTQQGSYFVFGTYELKPLEVLERNIELRGDLWLIPQADIESLRVEALQMNEILKNTEMAERAIFLLNGIQAKLNQIVDIQSDPPANPERYISNYRENVKTLESIKADMVLARSLLTQVKPMPAGMIWKMILAIVLFLGLLGLSFYFLWHKQIKVINEESAFYVPEKSSESKITRE